MKTLTICLSLAFLSLARSQYPVNVTGFSGQGMQWAQSTQQSLSDIKSVTQSELPEIRKYAEGKSKIGVLMAQQIALAKWNTMLQKFDDGTVTTSSPDSLKYDGKHISGGGGDYIDNIANIKGQPLAMDRQPPVSLVPISGLDPNAALLAGLTPVNSSGGGIASALTQSLSCYLGNSGSSAGSVLGQITGMLGNNRVGDGMFFRDYCGANDDAFAYSRTASSTVQLVLNSSFGSSYNPLIGNSSLASSINVNFDNILSGGQYGAVQSYITQFGGGNNQFAGSASAYLPMILNGGGVAPGSAFIATQAQIGAARLGGSVQLPSVSVPSLFGLLTPGRHRPFSKPLFMLCANGATATNKVLAATLPQGEAQDYNSQISANDNRLKENNRRVVRINYLISFTKSILKELQDRYDEGQKIRDQISSEGKYKGAPEITQLLVELNREISARQQYSDGLSKELEDRAKERYELLLARGQIRDKAEASLNLTKSMRMQSAVSQAQADKARIQAKPAQVPQT